TALPATPGGQVRSRSGTRSVMPYTQHPRSLMAFASGSLTVPGRAAVVLGGLQLPDPPGELPVLRLQVPLQIPAAGPDFPVVPAPARVGGQPRVVLPPVDADLTGGVEGGDDEPELDREELDIQQVDLDVARDHDPFV